MLNKVILMGRLTRDPELKGTATGTMVSHFTLAVDRDFVAQGEERKADFIHIVTFGQRAEFVNRYFHKGQMVAVTGRLQIRSWDDAQTGQKRYATDVVADEVHFAEPKDASSIPPEVNMPTGPAPQGFAPAEGDDNLPF